MYLRRDASGNNKRLSIIEKYAKYVFIFLDLYAKQHHEESLHLNMFVS